MTLFTKQPQPDFYDASPAGFRVGSWSPTPQADVDAGKPQAPSTQVHLYADDVPGLTLCWRFKGPGTLDDLIAALTKHREDVWGASPGLTAAKADLEARLAASARVLARVERERDEFKEASRLKAGSLLKSMLTVAETKRVLMMAGILNSALGFEDKLGPVDRSALTLGQIERLLDTARELAKTIASNTQVHIDTGSTP